MAGFLYVGAGIGMIIIALVRKIRKQNKRIKTDKIGIAVHCGNDTFGHSRTDLLDVRIERDNRRQCVTAQQFWNCRNGNYRTYDIQRKISQRLWFGILFITVSCGILSFEDISSLQFTYGSLFVLLAAVCWGFENNCTRKLSSKDPLQIVLLKGIFSGLGSIIIGLCIGERLTVLWSIIPVLLVGFIAYGLSIYFYVYAQRLLGAARTSAYYAISPFIAAILSLIIFKQIPTVTYFIALIFMVIGAWLSSNDNKNLNKRWQSFQTVTSFNLLSDHFQNLHNHKCTERQSVNCQ